MTENPATASSLAEVRAAIDSLDRQIVGLLAERQAQVVRAGQLKRGRPTEAVRDPTRVEEVVTRVREVATSAGADPGVVEAVYRTMIAAFTTLELSVHQPAD